MARTKKNAVRFSTIPGGLALGAGVSTVVTVLLAALIAKLVQSETLRQDQIGYGTMVLLMMASCLGALTAQGRVKHKRGLVCMLSGAVYFLILCSITALFFGGQYTGFGATALVVLGGAGTAALISGYRAGKGRRRPHRSIAGKLNLPS